MSIASRINEIGVHLTKDWRNIEALTGEVTVDKNIENIASVLDNFWETLPKATGTGTSLSLATKPGKMKVNLLGNTSQTGTPTPSSPIPVNVVSGDNTIVSTGKNLLETQYLPIPSADNQATYEVKNAYLSQGTYTLATTDSSNFGNTIYLKLFKDDKQLATESGHLTSTDATFGYSAGTYNYFSTAVISKTSFTFTIDNNYYVRIGLLNSNNTKEVMLVKGSEAVRTYEPYTSTSYPIHLGDKELCKIGDYQDKFIKTTGKNLFDNIITKQLITSNGTITNNDSWNLGDYIKVQPNTKYTFSRYDGTGQSLMIAEYNSSKTFIQRDTQGGISAITPYTITTTSTTEYIRLNYDNTKGNTLLQFELGETATSYEPYGANKWYLEKKIGKVVLDGTQSIPLASGTPRRFNATYTALGIANIKESTSMADTSQYRLNDHFIYGTNNQEWGNYYLYSNWLVLLDTNSVITDANALKTWFQNNNTSIYYAHNTPTYTQITGTLKDELEAVWRANSYKGTTNISQVNDDLAFELDVEGLSA